MKTRHLFGASLIGAAALLSSCNDNNTPAAILPVVTSFSDFTKSLIAMVTGGSCNTSLPVDVNSNNAPTDETPIDANTLVPGCTS